MRCTYFGQAASFSSEEFAEKKFQQYLRNEETPRSDQRSIWNYETLSVFGYGLQIILDK